MVAEATKVVETEETYDLGEVRANGSVQIVGSVKIESKITLTRQTSISDYEGIAWQMSSEEHSFELGDINDLKFFRQLWQDQKKDDQGWPLALYNFRKGGDYVEAAVLYGCKLSDNTYELSDKSKKTIKGEGLHLKYSDVE
jgi:hypothetical protein